MKNSSLILSGDYQRISKINKNYIKNEIYFSYKLTPDLLSNVRFDLPNLYNFELLEDRAIFISPVLFGKPLNEYEPKTSSEKIELLNSYLKTISNFSRLPIYMQLNLLRAENFYLIKGELKHRGILIIEDIDLNVHINHSHLLKAISEVALSIIGDNNIELVNFRNYFRDLSNYTYLNYELIIEEIKKVYINDLFVESKFTKKKKIVKKSWFTHLNIKFIILSLAFLFLIITASFSIYKSLLMKKTPNIDVKFTMETENGSYIFVDNSNTSSNIVIKEKLWTVFHDGIEIDSSSISPFSFKPEIKGNYTVSLKLKDNKGNWYKSSKKNIDTTSQNLKIDDLDMFDFEHKIWNNNRAHTGEKSLLFNKDNTHITIYNTNLVGNAYIEAMLYSNSVVNVDIKVEGFQNEKLVWFKNQSVSLSKDSWVPFKLNTKSHKINKIKIKFINLKNEISLDTLKIFSHR